MTVPHPFVHSSDPEPIFGSPAPPTPSVPSTPSALPTLPPPRILPTLQGSPVLSSSTARTRRLFPIALVVFLAAYLLGPLASAVAVPSVTDGGHIAGFYWKPTVFWFSNEQFAGDDSVLPSDSIDELAPTVDLGMWYMWNHPVLRSVVPGAIAGIRTGIGFVEHRDRYTAAGVGDSVITFTHFNTTIQVPIEVLIGIGRDRAVGYLGLGSGFSWIIEGPYSNLEVAGDETPYLDNRSLGGDYWPLERSTAVIYSFALGSILEIGERWVFEPRFVLNGTTQRYAADFDNTTHTMGVSFGFGRRFGE